ncbi:hypothetical protein O0L34_g8732 [Tuta absoluta]|nr:hypothetical protein O0L34_g8732 [Tuta absoluta]
MVQMTSSSAGSRFSSHVTVNTPARSYSHGVGDPIPSSGRKSYQRALRTRRPQMRNGGGGYPRVKPSIPFNEEDRLPNSAYTLSPWQHNSLQEIPIPVLPPSPYKVDSPDPESLWPEGLFLPPLRPYAFAASRRLEAGQRISDSDPLDPYLLEGSEARIAVKRANDHGLYYFHDIPHIESLLANQELRLQNQLKLHRLGSIRHTWPYNRP